MAAHVPAQPTVGVGTANKSFITSLQILDRNYLPEIIEKYGADSYTMMLDLIGKKFKVENSEFYHRETRKVMPSAQVASTTGGATAGADCTIVLKSTSHFDSGKKSPLRVGDVVQDVLTGVLAKITSQSDNTANQHAFVCKPLKSTDTFKPSNDDWVVVVGLWNVGEASEKHGSVQPIFDKITNYVTEVRDDYEITDKAHMERLEISYKGQNYFKYIGTAFMEKRWIQSRENLTMFSELVSNTGITANGTTGTRGAFAQITAGGSTLSYSPGSLDEDDLYAVTRELTFNGVASGGVHCLLDVYAYQEIQKFLFSSFSAGAVVFDSVGGSKEASARFGFSDVNIDGYDFFMKKYAPFSPEWSHGVRISGTPKYRNTAVFIPQTFSNTTDAGRLPSICLRYQEIPGVGEINAYAWGGLAPTNKTGKQELVNTMIGHYGVQVTAANQCVILKG